MDTLSQLIQNEVARRVESATPRIPYGVWIEGMGWLKDDAGRVFADLHVEIAQSAAHLWGDGAHVMPIDLPDANGKSALQMLEAKFLEHQRGARARQWRQRFSNWIRRIWIRRRVNIRYGLSRFFTA